MRDEALFPCTASRAIPIASCNSKADLTPFMQLKGFHEIPVELEKNPEFPVTTQAEPHVPHLILR